VRSPAAFAFLVLLCISHAAAQAPSDADVTARLKDLSDNYATRDRRETLKLVDSIVALPDLTAAQRVEALRIKGNAEIAVGSSDQAAATLQAAIAALPAAPDERMGVQLQLALANAYRGQKKLAFALRESRAAQRIIEALGDDALLLECLTAQIHYIDEPNEAEWRPVADRAMALAEKLGERGAQGRIHHILADRAFTKGEYASAVRSLEQAVSSLREAGAAEEMALSRALTSLGRARRAHGLPERALDAYREAMAVQKKTGDRFGVVQTWNAMGVAWSHMDRPDKSLECYRNGLAEAVALGDQSAVQFMEGAVATALLRSRKAAEAIPIFEGLLAKNPEPYIARFRLAALADAYLEVGRPADALATVDKALALDQASHPDALATFQFTRARANAALGRQDAAIADARTALGTYERIRQSLLPLDFVKRGYSDLIQGVFDFTVGALEDAGRHAEAVEAAEAARGRALADLMASRQSGAPEHAPATASDRDAATLLTGAGSADAAPAGLDSPVATQALSSRELSALAAAHHTTIVSYWVGADRSLVWVIRGDGTIFSATLPVTRVRLQHLVDQASRPPTITVRVPRRRPTWLTWRLGGSTTPSLRRSTRCCQPRGHASRSCRTALSSACRLPPSAVVAAGIWSNATRCTTCRRALCWLWARRVLPARQLGGCWWPTRSHAPAQPGACRRYPVPGRRSRPPRPSHPLAPCDAWRGLPRPNPAFARRWLTHASCTWPRTPSCRRKTLPTRFSRSAAMGAPSRRRRPTAASPPPRSTTCT
jgi:tetratricopeptide (TPR) repeat protein